MRKIGDETVIHHISADLENLSGCDCVHDARAVLLGGLVIQTLFRAELLVLLLPRFDLMDAAAGILVQRNVVLLNEFRIVGLDPVRHIFGIVLAGFGDIVAELHHDLQTDHVAGFILFLPAPLSEFFRGDFFDFRIDVLSALCDVQQPGHVIDAGDFSEDVLALPLSGVEAERVQKRRDAALDGVAQTDRPDRRTLQHGAGQDRHRIGVVEEPGVRTDLFQLMRKIQHDGNRAEGAEDSADAERVGDRLAQTIFFRDFEVDHRRGLVSADLDGIDDKIGVLQRFLPVCRSEIAFDRRPAVVDAVIQSGKNLFGFLQTGCINVVQCNFRILESFPVHAVAQHVFDEDRAAGSHESDFYAVCHFRFLFFGWFESAFFAGFCD